MATELRVVAVTVELLLRLRPRLLTLLRLEAALTTGGGAETVLEAVEKVLAEEWSTASLSMLVCYRRKGGWGGERQWEGKKRETYSEDGGGPHLKEVRRTSETGTQKFSPLGAVLFSCRRFVTHLGNNVRPLCPHTQVSRD